MPSSALRLVFAGTPDFAARHLQALISAGFNVVSVYSQPDRPAGRGKQLQATPVKAVALAHNIPVYQPEHFDADELARLAAQQADVMVVVAYGLLLPAEVLATPRLGCVNVHASLLPRWRGAAPIERAIMSGDAESGICLMQMETGLDTGPVLQRLSTPIQPDDNSQTLGERLCQLGCQALCEALPQLEQLQARAEPQDPAAASYARKVQKSEALIDWQRPAAELHNLIRALYPRAPAWTPHQGKRLRLISSTVPGQQTQQQPGTVLACSAAGLDIACGSGVLRVLQVQQEGRNIMDLGSLLNGHPDAFRAGQLLGSD
jgi:methionyl-tRNA formyltransferase